MSCLLNGLWRDKEGQGRPSAWAVRSAPGMAESINAPSPDPAPAPTSGPDPAPAPAPAPALPRAAEVVVNSPPNEDAEKLRRDLEEERRLRKADQTRVSELEDENHRLKSARRSEPARPKKAPGFTLLHGDD